MCERYKWSQNSMLYTEAETESVDRKVHYILYNTRMCLFAMTSNSKLQISISHKHALDSLEG